MFLILKIRIVLSRRDSGFYVILLMLVRNCEIKNDKKYILGKLLFNVKLIWEKYSLYFMDFSV